jgi:hypothetical protein
LVITRVIVGNSTTSSQLEAGSIMVRAIKSIDEPSVPLRVCGPIRSTHRASQGMHITILDGKCPYLSDRFLFTWQVLHDFVMDRMVIRRPFQYIAALLSLRDGYARVLKIMVVPYRRTPLQRLRYYEPTFMAYANFRFQQIEVLVLCLELHCS